MAELRDRPMPEPGPHRPAGEALVDLTGRGDGSLWTPPDREAIRVRPVRPTDAAGLGALYRRLPSAQWVRHLGVCDAHDRGFAARVASIGDRGGRGLVAEAAAPTGQHAATSAEIVGEAHVERLRGDTAGARTVGELVLVLAPDWRDWLGPRLLDAMLDVAAAGGYVHVEVDVMRSDTWLHEQIEARSHAAVPTDDWLSTRVALGVAGAPPAWAPAPGPRVLVETPGARWHAAAAARAAGMAVMVCAGPGSHGVGCPLEADRACPLVGDAEVVVVSYPPDRPEWDDLVAAHRRLHPDVPVFVEGRAGQEVPPGVTALDVHDPAEVVARISSRGEGGP